MYIYDNYSQWISKPLYIQCAVINITVCGIFIQLYYHLHQVFLNVYIDEYINAHMHHANVFPYICKCM